MKAPVCQSVRSSCGPSRLSKSACKVEIDVDFDDDDDDDDDDDGGGGGDDGDVEELEIHATY